MNHQVNNELIYTAAKDGGAYFKNKAGVPTGANQE